jgi:hypothetical protein
VARGAVKGSWSGYDTFKVSDVDALRERALHAEALVRAKDETIGELLDVIDMHPAELDSILSFTWSAS